MIFSQKTIVYPQKREMMTIVTRRMMTATNTKMRRRAP
jgi:hypothetical protein